MVGKNLVAHGSFIPFRFTIMENGEKSKPINDNEHVNIHQPVVMLKRKESGSG